MSAAEQLTDARLDAVLAGLKKPAPHEHGEAWWACERERSVIAEKLKADVRLTKIGRLLQRQGVVAPYSSALADGEPGDQLQIDPGLVGVYEPDAWRTNMTSLLQADLSPSPEGDRLRAQVWQFKSSPSTRCRFAAPRARPNPPGGSPGGRM